MPRIAPQLHLSLARGNYTDKPDGFRIRGGRGNIQVEAAMVPTLLFGVNWYLKYMAHLNVSTLPLVHLRNHLFPFRRFR
jgi:alpha-N-acetylglucosaminidase